MEKICYSQKDKTKLCALQRKHVRAWCWFQHWVFPQVHSFLHEAFSASGVSELHGRIALGQADVSDLSSLKSERDRIQKEIKTLKEELNNL